MRVCVVTRAVNQINCFPLRGSATFSDKDLTIPKLSQKGEVKGYLTVVLKPRFTKGILLFVFLGLLAFVLYFFFFVGTVNVADVIKRTNLFYYMSAFIAFSLSIFFSSLTWHNLLSNLAVKTRIRRVFSLMWVGIFLGSIIPEPVLTGDLTKAYLLTKTSGQDAGKVVASVVGQKVIVMMVTVFDLVLGLILLARHYTLTSSILIFIAVVLFLTTFSVVIICYFSAKPKATKKMLDWLIRVISFVRRGRWDSLDFRLKAEGMLNKFHEGIRTLTADPVALVRPIAFSLLAWNFDVLVIFLTFASLGYPVPVDKVFIVYALTGSLQAMGVAVVGFTELVMSSSYTVLGIPPAVSLSVTLLTRVVTLWFKLIVAYVAFQWTGVETLLHRNKEHINPQEFSGERKESA